LMAVVPVFNEGQRLLSALANLSRINNLKEVILVVNGADSPTRRVVHSLSNPQVGVIEFTPPLGMDIPRAVGAAVAIERGASRVVFYDGDMIGEFAKELDCLYRCAVDEGLDMALTNCYTYPPLPGTSADQMFKFRCLLNESLGIAKTIGGASPSHGPHLLSRKLLLTLPLEELAVPPVFLALAVRNNFRIGVGTVIPHRRLGSSIKDDVHSKKVVETVIGDNLEAMEVFLNKPRKRSWQGRVYIGYHSQRRFDLLAQILADKPVSRHLRRPAGGHQVKTK